MRSIIAIFVFVFSAIGFESASLAQLDMACYESCAREMKMRPDYCQTECTKVQPPQANSMPAPPVDEGYKPWGAAAGAEAGRREANRDAMEMLQMQKLYQENLLRKQQLERQQGRPAPGLNSVGSAITTKQIGITDTEIAIGTIQDLSGPLAGFGKELHHGMQMRINEVNAAGGINGRKLRFIVEDSGYDPQRGLIAAQKLVRQEKIFAMVGTSGAAVNLATLPVLIEGGVLNLFPMSAAREMYEPFHKLKFAVAASYYDQMRVAAKWIVKGRGAKRLCVIYQDDEFGNEVLKGAEDGLRDFNMSLAEKTSFKRGSTDFSEQVSKMKIANCDTVLLGTIVRETIGTIGTARKMGWNPNFIGSAAAYTDLIHKLGGKAMDGLYAMHHVAVPYADDSSKSTRDWFAAYKANFNEEPSQYSAYGYAVMDMFVQTAKKAGVRLTTDSFIGVLESTNVPRDFLGSPEYQFGPGQHLGSNKSKVGQLQNGRWVAVTSYLSP